MLLVLVVLLDVVVTVDGRRIEGKVLKEDERSVELQVRGGRIVIPRERVEKVIRCPTVEEKYERRRRDVKNAEDHYRLGLWCLGKGLRKEARREFEEALKLEPQHTGAKEALKHLRKEEERRRITFHRDPAEAELKRQGRIPEEHRLWRLGEWRLSTDLPRGEAFRLLKVLEDFLRRLRRFYPNMVPAGTKPMLVLVFSSREQYRKWLKKEKLERFTDAYGCYVGPLHKSFVFADGGCVEPFLLHECMHQIWVERMKRKRGGCTPMWLFEGMAEFAEGWWDAEKRRIVVGRVHKPNLAVLKRALKEGKLIEWDEFLAAKSFDDLFKRDYENERCYVAYAQAWGLYFYLARRYKERLMRYLQALAAGEKPDFGKIVPDLDKLHSKMQEFVSSLR